MENIAELEENLAEFEQCDPDNTQKEADLDNKLHLTITKSISNPIMQISMEPIYLLLPRMRNYIYANIEDEKRSILESHKDLIFAISNQNGDNAYKIMQDHLKRTTEIYEKYMSIGNHQTNIHK